MQKELNADIVIIGGGTGGCAAAIAALRMGKHVIMTEETDWIGGQLTSQAVPPDEHTWIEKFGCTRSYRKFRDNVRKYYKRNFPLAESASQAVYFNPGNAIVSRISHDPRVSLAVLEETLARYVHSQQLEILRLNKVCRVETIGDKVSAIIVEDTAQNQTVLTAPCFLDATECGDILPLAGIEYVSGAESIKETGELHALNGAPDPLDIQSITSCFAMDYFEGEDHTIDKPEDYNFWKNYQADFWPDKQLSWTYSQPRTLEPIQKPLFLKQGMDTGNWSLWHYRRIADMTNFSTGFLKSDITMVNWPQNDYWLGPVYEVDPITCQKNLRAAKQLSLSLLYWMQTEAPRVDGDGYGYPGLRLRKDVVGTEDGLAKYPYIRESRRIKAEFTIVEQHLNPELRNGKGAEVYEDTVGIGYYHIDLHPSTGGRNYIDVPSLPFQIPLGSLIPVRVDNLLPACKNIGTTHITNGCYRLHPVEWNIGETAGALAAYCLTKNVSPRAVRNDKSLLEDFQKLLYNEGVELSWPKIP